MARAFAAMKRLGFPDERSEAEQQGLAIDPVQACVQSPKCGNRNVHLDKGGAIELMSQMLKRGG